MSTIAIEVRGDQARTGATRMRVRPAEIDATEFEHGLRCADCGVLLIDMYGKAFDGVEVFERRDSAVPCGEQRFAWAWLLICKACSCVAAAERGA